MTSFKVCEILAKNNSKIELVVFLIDRVDLNDQTFKNFKKFTIEKKLIKNSINANNHIELLIDSKT
ncbi:MAG: DEAD/DEAH box helicase family protein, partial [Clostridia bacterium]